MPLVSLVLLSLLSISELDKSLNREPNRVDEWKSVLSKLNKDERVAGEYLLTFMPLKDLKTLPTEVLIESAKLSVSARKATSWGSKLPQDIFLDNVTPYASVTEPRQSKRTEFNQRYLGVIKDTKSPGEAAQKINQILFRDYKVTYNTRRLRTDQSSPETIAQGMATCTGLSIMLVDALRAVGVPARVAGIPSWPGRGGNHTWVEVWDNGWHFVGAAEPDANGLNHAWFAAEASQVPGKNEMESIYAVTYRPTGTKFPLVWAPSSTVYAENVTQRYHKDGTKLGPRLMVEVKENGERVMADVIAINAANGDQCLKGRSLGPNADMNLHLMAPAKENETYEIKASYKGKTVVTKAAVKGDTVVRINLDKEAKPETIKALENYFGGNLSEATKALSKASLSKASWGEPEKKAAIQAFLSAPNESLKAEFDAKVVKTSDRTAPYLWRKVGEKPENGWGLVIAMHGGGGAPQEVNDREWQHMFNRYYKDHPEMGGYIYLALRAPNNEWDGFYDAAISPLVERLIHQFVKFEGVNPNQVVACGASHGGYGTFVIGPKIAYRFAALHPAAGAQSPGRTAAENLRNVHFTWAVGENDTAYGRIKLCREFQTLWDSLRAKHGGFDGGLEEKAGKGHIIGDSEADQLTNLLKYRRESTPKKVLWTQTDDRITRFYWIETPKPITGGTIEAEIKENEITIVTKNVGELSLWLSDQHVNLKKPITVIRDGVKQIFKVKPSLTTFCEGLVQTNDPYLSTPVKITVK